MRCSIASRNTRTPVQAFQWIDPARALDLARQADRQLRSKATVGPLHGIPIGIKDIIETQGIPTTMGSPIFDGYVPARSAALVQRAEAAGAFVLGKTVTTEFAFFTPGKTRNPWNAAHTPGGSSSGSAAAVAMGFLPGAVGTQTNGSMIRPAAFCGVVGYKPTAGLISLAGVHPFSPSLDQPGVFARSVPDAALLAAVLAAKADDEPATGTETKVIPGEVAPMVRALHLAAVRSPVWHLADPHAQEHFLEMVARLRAAGAQVEEQELPPSFEGAHAVHRTIMYAEGARVFAELQRRDRNRLSPRLNALIDEGLGIPDSDLARGLEKQEQLARELDAFLSAFDGLITPPALGRSARGSDADRGPRLLHHLVAVRCARRHHPDGTRSGRPALRPATRGPEISRRAGTLGCPLVRRASRVGPEDRRLGGRIAHAR